ncbi:MAG: hypothetical protein JW929_00580 [Anaerolineales bacterium]|nr:hypothetical protein [Anaerolineales bacterium]
MVTPMHSEKKAPCMMDGRDFIFQISSISKNVPVMQENDINMKITIAISSSSSAAFIFLKRLVPCYINQDLYSL